MNKVQWGIISTADIGAVKVIPAMQKGTLCDIEALASRSLEKAAALAAQLKIPRTFGSYEELLACKDIDAVYILYPPAQPSACPVVDQGPGSRQACSLRKAHRALSG